MLFVESGTRLCSKYNFGIWSYASVAIVALSNPFLFLGISLFLFPLSVHLNTPNIFAAIGLMSDLFDYFRIVDMCDGGIRGKEEVGKRWKS